MAVIIPPTPTPMPAAVAPPINVPTWNVWQFADDAVGAWNRFGSTPTQVIQVSAIVVLVLLSMILLFVYVRSLSNENDDT